MLKKTIPLVTAVAVAVASMAPLSQVNATEGHAQARTPQFWWPNQLNLSSLRQHSKESNPYGEDFNYAAEFKTLNIDEVKKEIVELMGTSQDWWPADYGNYGPFFIRMAWHSAGTYRTTDGRGGAAGGQLRFEPLNSWPDNGNLDKARRLLWPIKQKHGRKISWADLMVLAGTVAMESMGFETYGFAGGRTDDWEPDLVFWGSETEFLSDAKRFHKGSDRTLKKPLAPTQLGLIYVNPEGPGGNHSALDAAKDIRHSFGRMAMNDEETVALIAGGHTFGKAHGARKEKDCVGPEPAAAGVEEQGLGWINKCGTGKGVDTMTSGLEGAWTSAPAQWTHQFFSNLFNFTWVQAKSPTGAVQWVPSEAGADKLVPDAHDPSKRHAPIMLTTDLSLIEDPAYRVISKSFLDDPKKFEKAFAKAWFKLTHRDMGPRARYISNDLPAEDLVWQDPIPKADYTSLSKAQIKSLKADILDSGLTVSELVRTAWSSASSFRGTDMRGGANGARLALAPQKDWAANNPAEVAKVIAELTKIKDASKSKVSLADMIVLGGAAAIEKAAKDAGQDVSVPFEAGRADTTQALTDVASFADLEPTADGFRNYYKADRDSSSPADMLVDKANKLTLTVPEMTVLIGGLRALNANTGQSKHGIFTDKPGTLSNDFFVNLLDMSTKWTKSNSEEGIYNGNDRVTGKLKWTATPVDLVFGSNSELRTIAEVYASDDASEKFTTDFVKAWTKVMTLDRFDLK